MRGPESQARRATASARNAQRCLSALCLLGGALAGGARAQESDALYDAAIVQLGPYGPGYDRLLELDGDGHVDALGLSVDGAAGQALIRLYTNDGTGRMSSLWDGLVNDAVLDAHTTAAIGDVSGDGAPDLLLGGGDKVWAWRTNGLQDPTSLAPVVAPASWGRLRGLVSADFDADGLDDIAALFEQRIGVWFVDASYTPANFASTSLPHPVGETIERLAVVDLDGDGADDLLAVSDAHGNSVHLLTFTGQSLSQGAAHAHNLFSPQPAPGDVDGDGDVDVVLFGDSGNLRILRQDAPGAFTLESIDIGGPAQLLVDVDGDGDLDGVGSTNVLGTPNVAIPNVTPSQFLVALNTDGLGDFAPAFEIAGLGAARLAGAQDLDGDGDIELIGGRAAYFPKEPLSKDPTPSLGTLGNEHLPSDIYDVDRDGDPDAELDLYAMLTNRGDGDYSQSEPLVQPAPEGTWVTGPTFVGDWDGDGDVDMIVLHWYDGNDEPVQRLLVNAGGGYFTFGPEVTAPGELIADTGQTAVQHKGIPVDADGDGDKDLIYTSLLPSFLTGPDSTDLWLNDGNAFFTKLWASSEGTFVAFVELDDDGLEDLVLAHQVLGLGWKKGLGGGQFGAIQWFSGVGYVDSVHGGVGVADFDNDSDIDLFVISDLDTLVFVENNGGGSFTEHVGILPDVLPFSGATERSVLAADADGDGQLDLIVSPAGHSTQTSLVYRFVGPGPVWDSAIEQVFKPHSSADVDGDGDDDLLGAEIYDNTRFVAPFSGWRRQFGTSSAGTGGAEPILGESGPVRFGESPEIRLRGALGGTFAILAVGISEVTLADTPFPGMTAYVNPLDVPFVMVPLPVSGPAGVAGAGEITIPVGVTLSMINGLYSHQFFILDPASPTLLTHTNGMMLLYGG